MFTRKLTVNGTTYDISVTPNGVGQLLVTVNGQEFTVKTADALPTAVSRADYPKTAPKSAPLQDPKQVFSLLPGRVVSIKVKVGQQVAPGDTLLVIESMKMQNSITAAIGGKVAEILVKTNDSVLKNQPLIKLE